MQEDSTKRSLDLGGERAELSLLNPGLGSSLLGCVALLRGNALQGEGHTASPMQAPLPNRTIRDGSDLKF